MAYVIRPDERAAFKRCRRAWDLGSRSRRNLEPVERPGPDFDRAIRDALAVYYFPGMWEWDRTIVKPLARDGFLRSLDGGSAALRDEGLRLLDRYFAWAPTVDRFVPIRVATDFRVRIPHPDHPDRDLASPAGDAIEYEGRIDLLVVDPDEKYWMVVHRTVPGDWTDVDHLVLEEPGSSFCWAWELFYLGMRITGVIYNELRRAPLPADVGAGEFVRRTHVRRSEAELQQLRRQAAQEAVEMADPAIPTYPHPVEEHCRPCAYRRPCIALNQGVTLDEAIGSGYRRREPEVLQEGRLGGVTWSMNRGAAPPRFDSKEGRRQ